MKETQIKEAQIKVSQVIDVWNVLSDLIDINDNPFRANARRLLFKLQPEAEFLSKCSKKDIEAVNDKSISLGEKIPPPTDFPEQYRETLELVCEFVPVKSSQIEKLLKE